MRWARLCRSMSSILLFHSCLHPTGRKVITKNGYALQLSIYELLVDGFDFKTKYKKLLSKKDELSPYTKFVFQGDANWKNKWYKQVNEAIGKEMKKNGLVWNFCTTTNFAIGMPVIVTFLTEKTDDKFYAAVFNSKGDSSTIVGNIELTIEEIYLGGDDDLSSEVEKEENAMVAELMDFDPSYVNDQFTADDGNNTDFQNSDVASCVVPSGTINPFKTSQDADNLLRTSA